MRRKEIVPSLVVWFKKNLTLCIYVGLVVSFGSGNSTCIQNHTLRSVHKNLKFAEDCVKESKVGGATSSCDRSEGTRRARARVVLGDGYRRSSGARLATGDCKEVPLQRAQAAWSKWIGYLRSNGTVEVGIGG